MNDEAESSRAGQRYAPSASVSTTEHEDVLSDVDEEEQAARLRQRVSERRSEAKRKRIVFLDQLVRDLDNLVFLELITLYYLDCSFFWFAVRALTHLATLTPLPDMGLHHQNDQHKPYLPIILFCFSLNSLLHSLSSAPSAGEDTRGYLHGGLMIDFIGQQGPTSKWKLVVLDICVMMLQLVMVSVTVKKKTLKRQLQQSSPTDEAANDAEGDGTQQATGEGAAREQDVDAEERGVLRRTDTLSDIGGEQDEEEALLPASDAGSADALDLLFSGQCVIGEFTLIDTLLEEHRNYQAFRQTQMESGSNSSVSPSTLRQLHAIRARFAVGG